MSKNVVNRPGINPIAQGKRNVARTQTRKPPVVNALNTLSKSANHTSRAAFQFVFGNHELQQGGGSFPVCVMSVRGSTFAEAFNKVITDGADVGHVGDMSIYEASKTPGSKTSKVVWPNVIRAMLQGCTFNGGNRIEPRKMYFIASEGIIVTSDALDALDSTEVDGATTRASHWATYINNRVVRAKEYPNEQGYIALLNEYANRSLRDLIAPLVRGAGVSRGIYDLNKVADLGSDGAEALRSLCAYTFALHGGEVGLQVMKSVVSQTSINLGDADKVLAYYAKESVVKTTTTQPKSYGSLSDLVRTIASHAIEERDALSAAKPGEQIKRRGVVFDVRVNASTKNGPIDTVRPSVGLKDAETRVVPGTEGSVHSDPVRLRNALQAIGHCAGLINHHNRYDKYAAEFANASQSQGATAIAFLQHAENIFTDAMHNKLNQEAIERGTSMTQNDVSKAVDSLKDGILFNYISVPYQQRQQTQTRAGVSSRNASANFYACTSHGTAAGRTDRQDNVGTEMTLLYFFALKYEFLNGEQMNALRALTLVACEMFETMSGGSDQSYTAFTTLLDLHARSQGNSSRAAPREPKWRKLEMSSAAASLGKNDIRTDFANVVRNMSHTNPAPRLDRTRSPVRASVRASPPVATAFQPTGSRTASALRQPGFGGAAPAPAAGFGFGNAPNTASTQRLTPKRDPSPPKPPSPKAAQQPVMFGAFANVAQPQQAPAAGFGNAQAQQAPAAGFGNAQAQQAAQQQAPPAFGAGFGFGRASSPIIGSAAQISNM